MLVKAAYCRVRVSLWRTKNHICYLGPDPLPRLFLFEINPFKGSSALAGSEVLPPLPVPYAGRCKGSPR